jgi:hypothetical protein
VKINSRQPQKVPKFTDIGFEIRETPAAALKLLQDFYQASQKTQLVVEDWPAANTYVNHWEVPTYMINLPEKHHPEPQLRSIKAKVCTL